VIRASLSIVESKGRREKHATLAGLCPRVSGHVKSQGFSLPAFFDKHVRQPGVRCLSLPFRGELAPKMQGDLSLLSEAPKSILQKTDRDDLTDGQLNGIECYRSQTHP
jgi:hypothetical protein